MDVFPGQRIPILVTNAFNALINLTKHERVGITCQPPLGNIHTKEGDLSTSHVSLLLPDSVRSVHYKPASNHHQQIQEYETIQRKDDGRLNNDWLGEVTIDDRYEKH